MNNSYSIIRSFLKQAVVDSNIPLTEDIRTNLGLNIEVHTSPLMAENGLYSSDLCANISRTTDSGEVIYSLRVIYSAIVAFEREDISDDQREFILTIEIPQSLYNKVRNSVWNLTEESDLVPLMLPEHSFLAQKRDKTETIDFISTIQTLSANEQYRDIIGIYSTYVDNPFSFTDSPLYYHYLRFFTPMEYKHPDLSRCSDTTWQQLLVLLFANPDVECSMVYKESLPELQFSYLHLQNKLVSELSTDEIEALMTCMVADCFATVLPKIITANINQNYAAELTDNETISLQKLQRLYNINELSTSDDISFVYMLHQRISHYRNYCKTKKLS